MLTSEFLPENEHRGLRLESILVHIWWTRSTKWLAYWISNHVYQITMFTLLDASKNIVLMSENPMITIIIFHQYFSEERNTEWQKLNLIPPIMTKCHMQIAWIWMRRWVTRHLTQIQAVCHLTNIFTNFELHWSILKIEADLKFNRQSFIWRAKG